MQMHQEMKELQKNKSLKCINNHFLQTICIKHILQGVDFFEKISKIRYRRSNTR